MEVVAGFPRYDQYKDSGVEWIGEVPAHWAMKRNKQLFREKKETVGKNAADYTLLSLTLKGVIARDMENPQGKFPAEFDSYKVVSNRDLIFCLFDIEETPRTVGLAHQDGMITGAYTVLECASDISERYLSYLYLSLDSYKRLKPLYTGLRKVIQRDTFMAVKTPIPPRDEQDRIANFLDQKTAEIDAAIAKKQRLIELLKEQKTILINQAVTQGLDPNVPMRDSGVEWIGQVPEHWEILQNRRGIRKIEQGSSPSLNNDIQDDTYSVLKLSAVKSGIYIDHEYKPIPQKFFRRAYQVKKGDFLMTRGNTPELVADICYVKDEPLGQVMMPDLVYRLEYDESIFDKEFMAYFFQSKPAREQIKLSARGSSPTMVKVSQEHIKSWLVPAPPLVEQRRIRAYLDKAVVEIGALIEQANQQIQMLGELKSVLISEAVTGKIKL